MSNITIGGNGGLSRRNTGLAKLSNNLSNLAPTSLGLSTKKMNENVRKPGVELAMVVDVTESMSGVISNIKGNFEKIVEITTKNLKIEDVKFAVITYSDGNSDSSKPKSSGFQNIQSINQDIQKIELRGGEPDPLEDICGGLEEAQKLEWSKQGAKKIVMWFGDAGQKNTNGGKEKIQKISREFSQSGVKVFAFHIYTGCPDFKETLKPVADETKGKYMEGFNENEIAAIIQSIIAEAAEKGGEFKEMVRKNPEILPKLGKVGKGGNFLKLGDGRDNQGNDSPRFKLR